MTEKIFSFPVRIYWEDTDAGGIVYHANYLRYMERARTEFLRSLGLEQRKMHLEGAPVIVVSSIEMKFVRPAVLDDALTVKPHQALAPRLRDFRTNHCARRRNHLHCAGALRLRRHEAWRTHAGRSAHFGRSEALRSR